MKKLKFNLMILQMLKRIVAFALNTANVAVTNSIAQLKSGITSLQSKIAILDDLYAQYSAVTDGVTKQRTDARTALATTSFSIMSSVYSYAIANNLSDLATNMKCSLGTLSHMPFQKLCSKIQNAINTVTPLLPSLSGYGITSLSTWQSQWDTLNSLLPTPEAAIIAHKEIGEKIDKATKDTNEFFRTQIDKLVNNLVGTDYFNGWALNRKLRNTGNRHTRLDAIVTNELGEPIYNVNVTVNSFGKDGKTFEAVSSETDIDGLCEVSTFEPGIRSVTLSGDSITSKTVEGIFFERGKATIMTFVCAPSFSNISAEKTATTSTTQSSTTANN